MKKEELYNTKIHVSTQTLSKIVQEYLFSLGFKWTDTGRVIHKDYKYIGISEHNDLYVYLEAKQFYEKSFKEIQISDLDVKIDWCIDAGILTKKQQEIYIKFRGYQVYSFDCEAYKYRGNINDVGLSRDTSFGTLLTFEEFELLFIKDKTMKEQVQIGYQPNINYHITKDSLVTLYRQFDCPEWRTNIESILASTVFKLGNEKIQIPLNSIELLIKEGTAEQKKAVEALGIILKVDKSITIPEFSTLYSGASKLIEVRSSNNSEFDKKSFYLGMNYNWEIKNDGGNLCLVPTRK